jgi:hypothetical protein
MMTAVLLFALACPCEDFAADVARRSELMAADVKAMPHVVEEGLRQLAFDAKEHRCAGDWPAIEAAIRDAAKETPAP